MKGRNRLDTHMMRRSLIKVSLAVGLAMGAATAGPGGFPEFPIRRCLPDAVVARTVQFERPSTRPLPRTDPYLR